MGQKAPSAKRCIKTHAVQSGFTVLLRECQKAPSAKRCIKTNLCNLSAIKPFDKSESTERQKVH